MVIVYIAMSHNMITTIVVLFHHVYLVVHTNWVHAYGLQLVLVGDVYKN